MKSSPITILALSAALLTGCTAAPGTAEQSVSQRPPSSPAQDIESSAGKGPVEFGKAFVTAAYTWDTRTGTDLTAALKRVEYMATDKLAAQFVAPQNATGAANWNKAARNQAHTVPEVSAVPEGNQAMMKSQPGTKKAGYIVTWDWTGPDGYRQDGGKDLVTLTLTETSQGWKVSSFEPTPLQ